jgi:hypothetical protein
MDEVLNKESLKDQMRTEFTHNFSKELIDANQQQIDQQIEQVANFLITFGENEYFSYFATRDPNGSIELHVSNFPSGIEQLENWLNAGLLDFAKNIFTYLTANINSNIHLARLLDNQDYEKFIINSETKDTNIEQWKLRFEPIFKMSETPYLTQAAACVNLSLDNAALSLLQLWVQTLWFEGKSIRKVFDDARVIVAIREHASKAGKKGSSTRWASRDKTQSYAVELWLKGNYKNASRASSSIKKQVITYGESMGFRFSEDRAFTTISKWLRDYIKEQQK